MDDTGEDDHRDGDVARRQAAGQARSSEWAIVTAVVLLLACWAMLVI